MYLYCCICTCVFVFVYLYLLGRRLLLEVWLDCISGVSITGVTPALVLHLSRTTKPDLPHEQDIMNSSVIPNGLITDKFSVFV